MAEIEVNGGIVVYDLIGPESGEVVVVTPGGRFSKDYPGVRPLGEALAAGGKRVLLWDRPNCGLSDIQLYGQSESHMRAETLSLMLEKLNLGPVHALGGSGGARDTLIFAIHYPDQVKKIGVWSIVGGTYSSISLAAVYNLSELRAIRKSGIDAVSKLESPAGSWSDLVKVNPRNKARLEEIGTEEFERVMNRWFTAFIPKPTEVIPGVPDWQFKEIDKPTLIIRGGRKDFDHPTRTSYEVHSLIKDSRLVEPPWPEDAWEAASAARDRGEGNIFDPWVKAAPLLLDWIA